MVDSISKFVQLLLAGIAAVAIPVVVAYVVVTLRALKTETLARLTAQQLALVEGGLQIFVTSLRQSGLLANMLLAGEAGLHDLANAAEAWLADQGLPGIDLTFLIAMVKHELAKQGIDLNELEKLPEGDPGASRAISITATAAWPPLPTAFR